MNETKITTGYIQVIGSNDYCECDKKCKKCGKTKKEPNPLENYFDKVTPNDNDLYKTTPYRVITTPNTNGCLIEEYFKNHPDQVGKAIWLSCPCPKCSPYSLTVTLNG